VSSNLSTRLVPHITAIAWANRTAFGSPLVPDVKIIKTGSAPFTSRCGTSGFAAATASR
jgi:hypothetical protein